MGKGTLKELKNGDKMNNAEEQLYYACSNFCESFFYFLCEKEKIRREFYWDESEKDQAIEFSEERLKSAYEVLFRSIEEFENHRKGVIGEKQYYLQLERIIR